MKILGPAGAAHKVVKAAERLPAGSVGACRHARRHVRKKAVLQVFRLFSHIGGSFVLYYRLLKVKDPGL
jgi:hypothetical protein